MKILIILLISLIAIASTKVIGTLDDVKVHHEFLKIHGDQSFYDFDGDARITNGSDAAPGQFPFVVRLSVSARTSTGIRLIGTCSGSLLNEHFVLSASHCFHMHVIDASPENVGILMGTVNRNVPGVFVETTEVWYHEQPDNLAFDIGVVRMAHPVQRSPNIDFIRIPTRAQTGYEFSGYPFQSIGWGLDNSGEFAVHLQYANFKILPRSECFWRVANHAFCFVNVDGTGSRTQNGDSGGPMIINEGGQPTQIGIHAGFITIDGVTQLVGTRVSMFLDWIQEHTGIQIS